MDDLFDEKEFLRSFESCEDDLSFTEPWPLPFEKKKIKRLHDIDIRVWHFIDDPDDPHFEVTDE